MRQFNQRITKIITNRKKKHHFTFSCQYKYVKEFHFCVIFPAKQFVLSMIIRIFPL